MARNKKPIVTPKRVMIFIIKLVLWLIPILIISTLLEIIITGGYSQHFIGDMIVSTTAVLILFWPGISGSFNNTFYKPDKPKVTQKPAQMVTPKPQVVANNNTSSVNYGNVFYWILIIAGAVVVFVVIKGFLDWWFGLFGLGIGLILLLLLFG
jgi:hypothetical protein